MALIPFDDRDGVIWMNGEMVDWRDARTHTLTHALHYGSRKSSRVSEPMAYHFLNHANIRKGFAHLVIIWISTCCVQMQRWIASRIRFWLTIILLMVMCGFLLARLGDDGDFSSRNQNSSSSRSLAVAQLF